MKLSRDFVRSMLSGHSVLGLTAAALLYIVCVSGTASIFYPQVERWEQPGVAESTKVDPAQIESAIANALEGREKLPEHVFVQLPTDDVPRTSLFVDGTSRFIHADGSLAEDVDHEWTHFLVSLHYALSLPSSVGLTLVGLLGVMMVALTISGLLAHPNIFKDAFSFRLGRGERLKQVDLHNRLSVWTSPFQLLIAFTGAFVGLAQVSVFVTSTLFDPGTEEAYENALFLEHAEPTGVAAPLAGVGSILEGFVAEHPDLNPMSLTVHEPATTAQAVEIGAKVPRRLVWGEFYLYDGEGNYVDHAGWGGGDAGTQVYASMFRPHFGHFAGLPVQFAYFALSIALCIVVATGVNIWLLRRAQRGQPAVLVQKLWAATVWGVPLAIAVSALGDALAGVNGALTFWVVLPALGLVAGFADDHRELSKRLRLGSVLCSVAVVAAHALTFGAAALSPAALIVNLLWLSFAAGTGLTLVSEWPTAATQKQEPAVRAAHSRD